MPKKTKEEKLKMEDIKKNPDIEKKHFIHKFIEHEHEIMLGTTALFMVLICFVIYVGAITIENKDKFEIYYDGSLKIQYNKDLYGVSDVVSLNEENIVSGEEGKKAGFKFSITNDSLVSVRYKVLLEVDENMIDLDECRDILVNEDALRYSINDGEGLRLSELEEEGYLIKSGVIRSSKTKDYELKMWIDKDSMEDIKKNHFHAKIVVLDDEED